MGADNFMGNGQPQSRTMRPGAALKGIKQVFARFWWNARAGVRDRDEGLPVLFMGCERNDIKRSVRGFIQAKFIKRLAGIADEIGKNAIELVVVGIDFKPFLKVGLPVDFTLHRQADG